MDAFDYPPDNIIINSDIQNHIQKPKFKNLKDELSKIPKRLESFAFFREELKMKEDGSNPDGYEGMYEPNFYEGQKILFAMFFSCDLETQKSETIQDKEKKINPIYVKSKNKNDLSIESVLKYYGYDVILVTNYEQAIKELTKTNAGGNCEYNSLWVISGKEVPDLPSDNGDLNAPYYVNQFVDCAIQFWKNGGSLVLMAENEPYIFQANLILKKLVFPDGKKCDFTIEGSHEGEKILKPDETGLLNRAQVFDKKIRKINDVERIFLGYGLYNIYEGSTISYVKRGNIDPFKAFSIGSDNEINSLYYNGEDRGNGSGEGNILIDCSYTKFFLSLVKEYKNGVLRYLQNIGGFIGSAERRANMGRHPKCYRPKKVIFTLNKSPLLFYNYPKTPFDIVYLVDATGSMSNSIEKVKNYCVEIAKKLNNQRGKKILYDYNFGGVFYRDPIDTKLKSKPDINEYKKLTSDIISFKDFVGTIEASGGGDTPEDWVGGYSSALYQMGWRKGNGNKLIIHIADAGAHGREYSKNDKIEYREEGKKLDDLIKQCSNNKIIIVAFKIGETPNQSFQRVKMLYEENNNGKNFYIQPFDQNNTNPDYFTNLVVKTVTTVTQ